MESFKKQGKARYIGIATHKFEHEAIRAAADMGIIAMKTMAGVYWDKQKTKPINTKASLKWVLQNENVHTTVPDCSNFSHIEQDLSVMENLELTEEEMRDLEGPGGTASSGLYCQQCNECISQCPENLDIPTIMRGYMYAYGYNNLNLARSTIDMANIKNNSCRDCSRCRVNCRMGFDIKGKIMDIARIRGIPRDMIQHV